VPAIEPILVVEPVAEDDGPLTFRFTVSNAGNGPALNTIYWFSDEPASVAGFEKFIKRRDDDVGTPLGLISTRGDCHVQAAFIRSRRGSTNLLVVQGQDAAGGIHQVQMLIWEEGQNMTISSFSVSKRRP
jgi:hypothetical protein